MYNLCLKELVIIISDKDGIHNLCRIFMIKLNYAEIREVVTV